MSFVEDGTATDRLSLGVAARLSRYLQVLTQARKMGKETISSQELSEYTHVNSTQIRRDLSGFGKFGKRDRKSTRLNSSHANISYAVFCLKKNKKHLAHPRRNLTRR